MNFNIIYRNYINLQTQSTIQLHQRDSRENAKSKTHPPNQPWYWSLGLSGRPGWEALWVIQWESPSNKTTKLVLSLADY